MEVLTQLYAVYFNVLLLTWIIRDRLRLISACLRISPNNIIMWRLIDRNKISLNYLVCRKELVVLNCVYLNI